MIQHFFFFPLWVIGTNVSFKKTVHPKNQNDGFFHQQDISATKTLGTMDWQKKEKKNSKSLESHKIPRLFEKRPNVYILLS